MGWERDGRGRPVWRSGRRVVVVLALVGAFVAGSVLTYCGLVASSCVTEDSARARVGTDRFGCVRWADLNGNGQGRTRYNAPGSDR